MIPAKHALPTVFNIGVGGGKDPATTSKLAPAKPDRFQSRAAEAKFAQIPKSRPSGDLPTYSALGNVEVVENPFSGVRVQDNLGQFR